jgi:hypothetical protein
MMESMLLLLLALGGGNGSPSASPHLAPPPGAVSDITGVWRGKWVAPGDRPSVPVEAVLAPGKHAGSLIGLVVSGIGRERRSARLAGSYDNDGAKLALPSGGALRLMAAGAAKLIGEIRIEGAAGLVPGDGAVELTRVRR